MIEIKECITKKEMKAFVTFPFSIYKDSPYWVPPIIKDELSSFDATVNPVFEHASANFFMAYKGNIPVGRVAAIINRFEVDQQGIKKVRFGWLDMIDDVEVTKALLNKVLEIGKSHQLEYMEGPMGFSNLDKVGLLTEGYDELSNMITWYNHPYYVTHLEQLGFVVEKEYTESRFSFSNVKPEFFEKASTLVKKRYGVKELSFTSTKDIFPYVDQMFDLFNNSYANLASFVAISNKQKEFLKKNNISFINPEFIKFVVDSNHKLVAFAIVMPSFSRALQKSKGKLFPFGIFHLLHARKYNKDAIFCLIGVDPAYQNKGVTAIIFEEYYKTFTKRGVVNCIRTPELKENIAIQQLWKHFNPEVYRARNTYKKVL